MSKKERRDNSKLRKAARTKSAFISDDAFMKNFVFSNYGRY